MTETKCPCCDSDRIIRRRGMPAVATGKPSKHDIGALAERCDKWLQLEGRESPFTLLAEASAALRHVAQPPENDPLADLVDRFSASLLEKLRAAEQKYGRKNDWLDPSWEADCQRQLLEHTAKGDPRDVAAYAAFCWHHGWPTAPAITSIKPGG